VSRTFDVPENNNQCFHLLVAEARSNILESCRYLQLLLLLWLEVKLEGQILVTDGDGGDLWFWLILETPVAALAQDFEQ
jgi:hypothetical protein